MWVWKTVLFRVYENLDSGIMEMVGSFLGDLSFHNVVFCPNIVHFQDKCNFHLTKNSLMFFG